MINDTNTLQPVAATQWINTDSPKVAIIEGVIWKEVPGIKLPGYSQRGLFASSLGTLAIVYNDLRITNNTSHDKDEYKSRYLTINLRNEDNTRKTYTVHRLVASAWHGPRSNDLVVNHIDGNKHNNQPSNLEWTTYSENSKHAIREGLTSTTSDVVCYDYTTKETKRFVSLAEFAKSIGKSKPTAVSILTASHGKLMSNGKIYYYYPTKANRGNRKSTIVKDYVNNKIHVTHSLVEACLKTNTHYTLASNTINTGELSNGCMFYDIAEAPSKWPYTHKKDLDVSIEYQNQVIYGVEAKDYVSGNVYKGDSPTELSVVLSKYRDVSGSTIIKYLAKEELEICKGYVFKLSTDDREYPSIDASIVQSSINNAGKGMGCVVKNYLSGCVYRYDSVNAAVMDMNEKLGVKLYTKSVFDNLGELLGGCVFKLDEDDVSFDRSYNNSIIDKSITDNISKVLSQAKRAYAKDYLTGIVYMGESARLLHRVIDEVRHVNLSSVERRLRDGRGKLLNGWGLMYDDGCMGELVWGEYSDEEIEDSVLATKIGGGSKTKPCKASKDGVELVGISVADLVRLLAEYVNDISTSSVRDRVVGKNSSNYKGWAITAS